MSAHSYLYTDADEPRKERYVSDACDFFLVFFFLQTVEGIGWLLRGILQGILRSNSMFWVLIASSDLCAQTRLGRRGPTVSWDFPIRGSMGWFGGLLKVGCFFSFLRAGGSEADCFKLVCETRNGLSFY